MISPTYGKVDNKTIIDIIKNYINEHGFENEYRIIIGTDSQNFHDTKMVSVLALINVGHGGIFFYDIKKVPKIRSLRQKLFYETQQSLDYAREVISLLDEEFYKDDFDYSHISFSIHVDAGQNGKTREVIPDIVEWVKACGFECETKPNSFVASSIADKYSK